MRIIELTEKQYNNYAKIHSKRNYFQSVEYSRLYNGIVWYLGMIDDNNNLHGATSLIINDLKLNYKYGYAPRGFLINFNDFDLLTNFTNELKKYLSKKNVVFVKLDPYTEYRIFDKRDNLLYENKELFTKLISLGYVHLGFNQGFEANNPRYEVILKQENINKAYNNLGRNVKRSIKTSSLLGITIHKGDINNLDIFYKLIKKKTDKKEEYYKNILSSFNGNYQAEIYFAMINPRIYMDNYRYLLDREMKINANANEKIQSGSVKNSSKLINKKIDSDRRLEVYNKHVMSSTQIYKNYPEGLIVGTALIIRNDNEVWFLIDGYNDSYKDIYSSYLLKWEIIKKYLNIGIRIFNLGGVTGNRKIENNKYYGIYFNKMSLGGLLYEYLGEFDLIVNKAIYSLFYNVMHFYKGK